MFKVGDLVKGISCRHKYTNKDMEIGKVEELWECPATHKQYMDVRIVKHLDKELEGFLYPCLNSSEYFEVIV